MAVRQHRRRRSTLAVVAAAGLVVVAACSGGGAEAGVDAADPLDAVHRAAEVLVRQGASRARTAMETAAGGTRVTIRGEGVYDFVGRRGRLTVRLPPDPSGAVEHEPITELLVPGALYMKNRGAGVPPDKWVRVDTTTLADGNLVTGGATDPLAAAEILRGARHVSYVGSAAVDGTRVRHFRGTADLLLAARVASSGARRELAAAAKGFSRSAVPFDAYLDDEGRVRKLRQEFSFAGGRRGAPVAVASTTLLYGFGTPARVTLPRAGDIFAGHIAAS